MGDDGRFDAIHAIITRGIQMVREGDDLPKSPGARRFGEGTTDLGRKTRAFETD